MIYPSPVSHSVIVFQIAGSLRYFVIAMIHYPEVMRRAQAQIDEVVGRDRLPSFSDREQLPYIEAMVKEVLRWRPVGPIGLPRQTAEVRGYSRRSVTVYLIFLCLPGRLLQWIFHT